MFSIKHIFYFVEQVFFSVCLNTQCKFLFAEEIVILVHRFFIVNLNDYALKTGKIYVLLINKLL